MIASDELEAAAKRYSLAMNEIKHRLAASDGLYELTQGMDQSSHSV